jgi:hypothetical protein
MNIHARDKQEILPKAGKASALALGLLLTLSGCGKQNFVISSKVEAQTAPGSFTIPAKVDILLVEDDTGSMNEIYPMVSSATPSFLTALEAKGWDYHFATIPLTTYRNLDQVTASHYDGNWGSAWIAPFPGATQFGPGTVDSSVFRTTDNYYGFLQPGEIQQTNGKEWGFDNMVNSMINIRNGSSNFIRDDAMLVVLDVGNGNDTSRVNFCDRGDGVIVSCDDLGNSPCSSTDMSQWGAPGATCASGALSFNYYKSAFVTAANKPSSTMFRFYAAVANRRDRTLTCQGANSDIGTRYQQMSSAFNGKSYDICSGSTAMTAALDSLSNDLQSVRLSFETRYLPISQEPDVSTIVVTRNDGVVIPQSSSNGWTYAGYVNNGYQIDYPVSMNQFSGYAIELHGSYKLTGSQTANVSYTPNGLHSTI